jgi:hypothetical protein
MSPGRGWIAVDLDGTLAYYDGWKGHTHIGAPIPRMLERVKDWIKKRQTVKIFTARAADPIAIPYIRLWLEQNGLPDLEITATKDFQCIEIWDDRAVQVVKNTGEPIGSADL